eukprot:XP_797639.2 PREDICTED: uncharacterized protein LOC593050 [Strongylocentrotus purpuratus]
MLAVCVLTFIAMSITAVPATTQATTPTPTTTPQPPNGIPQCAILECPVYTTLEEFGSNMWKRRLEPPGVWARKVAPTCSLSAVTGLAFFDLHNYFVDNGINKTTPITVRVSENIAAPSSCPDQSESFPCCDKSYALLFYIPAASQATAPPPPQDSGIELDYLEHPLEYYGITFGGRPFNHNATEKYEQLSEYLDEQGFLYDTTTYFVEAYDKPWDPQPYRNEIRIFI